MRIGILGGGFGLYGYLPAVCKIDAQPILLSKYEEVVSRRPEISSYSNKLRFVESETQLFEISDRLVFARNPLLQSDFIKNLENRFDHLYLEKPIGVNSETNIANLEKLESLHQSFSVGYLFFFTEWFSFLKEAIAEPSFESATITWSQILSKGWKGDEVDGGGLTLYYGIHLLAVVEFFRAFLAQSIYSQSKNYLGIECVFHNGAVLNLKLQESNISSFSMTVNGKKEFQESSPFGQPGMPGVEDPRVNPIKNYLLEYSNTNLALNFLEIEKGIQKRLIEIKSQVTRV